MILHGLVDDACDKVAEIYAKNPRKQLPASSWIHKIR